MTEYRLFTHREQNMITDWMNRCSQDGFELRSFHVHVWEQQVLTEYTALMSREND